MRRQRKAKTEMGEMCPTDVARRVIAVAQERGVRLSFDDIYIVEKAEKPSA